MLSANQQFFLLFLGALVAFVIGFLKLHWNVVGEIFLAVISLVQGGLIMYASSVNQLILAYVLHMAFGLLYQSAITIASYV